MSKIKYLPRPSKDHEVKNGKWVLKSKLAAQVREEKIQAEIPIIIRELAIDSLRKKGEID